MLTKINPKRLTKLLRSRKDRPCADCGLPGTDNAHYTGLRQHWFGKGRGIKGHDLMTAYLCRKCHVELDLYLDNKHPQQKDITLIQRRIVASEYFLFLVAKTLIQDIEEGILRT